MREPGLCRLQHDGPIAGLQGFGQLIFIFDEIEARVFELERARCRERIVGL